jgi:branched-chain amino acid transport system permease protein
MGSLGVARQRRSLAGVAAAALFLGTLPLYLNTPYALSTLVLIGIDTIVTLGLCLLMGYAGQISLGQAAFFAIGAYGSAILSARFAWSPWLAIVVVALLSAAIAYIVGIPVFRLSGHYLAMGTLAMGFVVQIVLTEWKGYTGGPSGFPGIPRLTIAGVPLKSDLVYYYLVWAVALAGVLTALNLVNSRFGRALRAVRDSESAAESIGIEVTRHKLHVLVISALYASVAGSLYAHYVTFVSPHVASLDVSIRLVLMAAVGGLASIWGAPFGAAAVALLTLVLRETIPLFTRHASGEHQIIAYGVLLVVIMLFMPQGVTTALAQAWERSRAPARIARLWRLARRR